MVRAVILSAALAAGMSGTAVAQELSDARIKELALQAILENPEIVMQAVEILREREAAAEEAQAEVALSSMAGALRSTDNAPFLGNPDGDIVLVEFFDYNCGFCKRASAAVDQLIAADPNIKVIFREWPILGDPSVYAARASLAAENQGKYEEFHFALMKLNGRATETSVLQIARSVGLDLDQLRRDMFSDSVEAHLAETMTMAQGLQFSGTPSFVLGDTLLPGLVPLEDMQAIIADMRSEG